MIKLFDWAILHPENVTHGRSCLMVMERARFDLGGYLGWAGGSIGVCEKFSLWKQTVHAMMHIHAKGYVHLDMKLANVLLVETEESNTEELV